MNFESENNNRTNFYYSNGKKILLEEESTVFAVKYAKGKTINSRGLSHLTRTWLQEESDNVDLYTGYGLYIYSIKGRELQAKKDQILNSLNNEGNVAYTAKAFKRSVGGNVESIDDLMFSTKNFIVKMKDNVSQKRIDEINKSYNVSIINEQDYMVNGFELQAPVSEGPNGPIALSNIYYEMDEVEFAHPNFVRKRRTRYQPQKISTRNLAGNNYLDRQWHLFQTRTKETWELTKGSPTVKIAILDDGIETNHQEFSNKIVAEYDFGSNVPDGNPKSDFDSHGTACAGVAVGAGIKAYGAAPDCSLIAVRYPDVLDYAKEAQMFKWTSDNGAHIISCSWGPPDGTGAVDPLPDNVRAAIKYCVKQGRSGKGIPVFWAAGNGNESVSNDGYAANPDVMAVAANNDLEKRSFYSDYGPEIFISAPSNGDFNLGRKAILTTDRSGDLGYNPDPRTGLLNPEDDFNYTADFGGTSSATPLVAGITGLILSVNDTLTVDQIREILKESADKIDSTNGNYDSNGRSHLYGYGRINALKAVQLASNLGNSSVSTIPSVSGPAQIRPNDTAPTFNVFLADRSFYALEFATDNKLFDFNNFGEQRNADNFYGSYFDGTSNSSSYVIPDHIWNNLKQAKRIYYRMFAGTGTNQEGLWTGFFVSHKDENYNLTPYIEIQQHAGQGFPNLDTTTEIVFPSGVRFGIETNPDDGVNYNDHVGNGSVPLVKVEGRKHEYLSKNFKVGELASKDINASYSRISLRLVEGLQHIRTRLGKGITVNSAYRNKSYNTKVGGALNSQHIAGRAVDIKASNTNPIALAKMVLEEFGCDIGIGLGKTIVHFDLRGSLATWVYEGASMTKSQFREWVEDRCDELGTNRNTKSEIIQRIRPEIIGPETYDKDAAEAPNFRIETSMFGYYAVEFATEIELFSQDGKTNRNENNFYGSWEQKLELIEEVSEFRMPKLIWHKLNKANKIFYRVVLTNDNDDKWEEVIYSVPPINYLESPWVKIKIDRADKNNLGMNQVIRNSANRDRKLWDNS